MAKLFAISGDPAASNLGLYCLPITLLGSQDYNGLMYILSFALEWSMDFVSKH